MRIQSLEIDGFKSFADRALFQFGHGVTGVVGPNGCGKSNIIDAIRWVMGEMSAKHLRGRAMQDVIFAGSDSRGPSGFAQVTLTMSNDGDVPPQYADYESIGVTRRLYRDGTSEYLINQVPCRLRDITDLFLGTGVGTKAYSIIEQGRIGFIVSARPEDRRTLIEEVAGITRFKARKKSAERRMAATEQNLQRVNDIVAELERQLGTLRRQAKRAERYKRVKEELRAIELHTAAAQYLELQAVDRFHEAQEIILRTKADDAQRELSLTEANIESEGLEATELETQLQHVQAQSAEADAKVAALERDISHTQDLLENHRSRIEKLKQEVESRAYSLKEITESQTATQAELETLKSAEDLSNLIAEEQIALSTTQTELAALDQSISELRAKIMEVVHGVAKDNTTLGQLSHRIESAEKDLERYASEEAELNSKREALSAEADQLTAKKTELLADQEVIQSKLEALAQELHALGEEEDRLAEERANQQDLLKTKEARLASLLEIAQRREDCSEGIRNLLGLDDHPAFEGIGGLLADKLKVAGEYERAIEAALGEALQAGVVEDLTTTGRAALAYLREHSLGRARLAGAKQASATRATSKPSIAGTEAVFCVEAPAELQPLVEALLNRVWVVDNLDTAIAQPHPEWTFVSKDGDLLLPSGLLEGGERSEKGLLAQQREIRELESSVAQLRESFANVEAALSATAEKRRDLEADRESTKLEERRVEVEAIECSKDLQSMQEQLQRITERSEILSYEKEQRSREIEEARTEHQGLSASLKSLSEEQGGHESALAEHLAERERLAAKAESLGASLSDHRVMQAERTQRIDAGEKALIRFGEEIERLRAEQEKSAEESQTLLQELGEAEEKQKVQETDLSESVGKASTLKQSLSALREQYEAYRSQRSEQEQSIKGIRHQHDLAKEALVQTQMDRQRLAIEERKLVEQILERHDLNLLDKVSEYHLIPAPTKEDKERQKELTRSLKNIGSVNLMAIEECKEVEERYEFLAKQKGDLEEAIQSLRSAIFKINKASRERFVEAFKSVNDTFMKLYPRLFRGGEARLELLPADDVLEAGVDIIAQPPGKKLQNVTLLSGGEKAMTATALVFAIFLVKPSPFCVLDEVDAPLDDANVSRFNELLREMSKISQFIVITHNKLTMTEADRLYGVTMEEPGMSKLVSVDMEGFDKPGARLKSKKKASETQQPEASA